MPEVYTVFVGEKGNEQGHAVGTSTCLKQSRIMARWEVKKYGNDGWTVIRSNYGHEERGDSYEQ